MAAAVAEPRQGALIAHRGDSSLFIDPNSLAMLVIDPAVLQTLDRHFEEDLERCEELRAEAMRHRGPVRKLTSRVVSLFRQEM